MPKFIISVDSCADLFGSYLKENNVHCIVLKRITNGTVTEELFDSYAEYENFYESIRKGALPTTSALNPAELFEHFGRIFDSEPEGDIIHISLASALSVTFDNAVSAADEINRSPHGRKVHVFDSLSASLGIAMQTDMLIEMRDAGLSGQEALKNLENFRKRQRLYALVDNLFHLKRGGRLSGSKAAIGSILKIKPVLVVNEKGGLTIEKTVRGTAKGIEYILDKMPQTEKHAAATTEKIVYIAHSSAKDIFAELKKALTQRFGDITIKESMVGPIIGTHVGAGTVAVAFEGEEGPDI